jgi:hypothetical protein
MCLLVRCADFLDLCQLLGGVLVLEFKDECVVALLGFGLALPVCENSFAPFLVPTTNVRVADWGARAGTMKSADPMPSLRRSLTTLLRPL